MSCTVATFACLMIKAKSTTNVMSGRRGRWYDLRKWRRRSRAQLLREPLCAYCLEKGEVVPATVADHIEPHRWNWNRFWMGQLQSLCKHHHDSRKQQEEIRGYSTDIGVDGFPLDRRHPFYELDDDGKRLSGQLIMKRRLSRTGG
jgi:5-methylcytosine-specific restriction enzyme A